MPVRFAIDGNGTNAEFLARANDAQGNFSAVRNQYLFEHSRFKCEDGRLGCPAGHSPALTAPPQTRKGARRRAPDCSPKRWLSPRFTFSPGWRTTPGRIQWA